MFCGFRLTSKANGKEEGFSQAKPSSSASFQRNVSSLGRKLLKDVSGLPAGVDPLLRYLKENQIPCSVALEVLPHLVEFEASTQPRVLYKKSLRDVESSWGVSGIENLKCKVQEELNALFERGESGFNREMNFAFLDQLFSLFLLSKNSESDLGVFRTFESFSTLIEDRYRPFLPRFYEAVEEFLNSRVSSHLIKKDSSGCLYGLENKNLVSYLIHCQSFVDQNGDWNPKNIVKEYWVDRSVLSEVSALKRIGYPSQKDMLFHSTGSAALHGIAQSNAILSAKRALKNGEIKTGEFVSYLDSKGVSMSGGSCGLSQVYTLRNSDLSYQSYSTIRWFDEFPVTFGIDVQAQAKFNEKNNVNIYSYNNDRKGEGTVVGPEVPLQNVRVVCAPKENEEMVSKWIAMNCPYARFISKEAATIFHMER